MRKNHYIYILFVATLAMLAAAGAKIKMDWIRERLALIQRVQSLTEELQKDNDRDNCDQGVKQSENGLSLSLTPDAILSELISDTPIGSNDKENNDHRQEIHSMRLVLYKFGLLTQFGENGLPAIQAFIDKGQNKNYPLYHAVKDSDASPNKMPIDDDVLGLKIRHHTKARGDFAFPPTLRLGLIDVLSAIGGLKTEPILANMLKRTKSGAEVYFIFSAMEKMVPGKYRGDAVLAARGLLSMESKSWPDNDSFGESNNDYLFMLLAECQDPNMSEYIQQYLIDENGRLNASALDYCLKTFKEKSIPYLEAAYKNSLIMDVRERVYIAGLASDYCGMSASANEFITYVINDKQLPVVLRTMMAQTLNGYNMFTKKYVAMDEETMKNRAIYIEKMLQDQNIEPFLRHPLRLSINMLQNAMLQDSGNSEH